MKQKSPSANNKIILKLYVSGMSQKSMEAIENIQSVCEGYSSEIFELEIIDIYQYPEIASEHHILFSPSLVRLLPLPRKVLIGTLKDRENVKHLLGFENP